jgi:hypothetical protein
MNLLNLVTKIAGKNKTVESLTGLLVGENSKKRNIGFGGFALSVVLFQLGYIDAELFDTLILVCAGWTGIAFSSKLSKLGEAIKETNPKKKKR